MYRLLPFTSSYGTGSFYSSAWQNGSQAGFYGQSDNYLNQVYHRSIETLLLSLVQQQIQNLLSTQNDTEDGESDTGNSNNQNNSGYHNHCGCPCPPPPPPALPAPEPISTYDEILENIQKLSQFIENNNIIQSTQNYNEYLSHSFRDQTTIRKILSTGHSLS